MQLHGHVRVRFCLRAPTYSQVFLCISISRNYTITLSLRGSLHQPSCWVKRCASVAYGRSEATIRLRSNVLGTIAVAGPRRNPTKSRKFLGGCL